MNAAIIPTFSPPWKTPDLIMLRSWYGCIATKQLASNLRRSVEEVEAKAVELGLMRKTEKRRGLHLIEPDERPAATVKKSLTVAKAPKAPKPAMPVKRVKPVFEVKPMRPVTGVLNPNMMKAARTRHFYSADELEELRSLYPINSTADVAKALGRSVHSVKTKAQELGLLKSPEHAITRQRRPWGACRSGLIRAMRAATGHLRSGDHHTALGLLESALARADAADAK